MHGILVIGGAAPQGEIVLPHDRFVVAADSGLDYVHRRGWYPDAIVGDMDSISDPTLPDRYPEARISRASTEKDETDTELGLLTLWDAGAETVTIIGGGGGRLDHTIALVALFDRDRHPQTWLTDKEIVECLDDSVSFSTKPGSLVSLFPAGTETCRARSEGLKWPLDTLTWNRGDVGISNESVAKRCRVEILSGRLLLVREVPSPIIVG